MAEKYRQPATTNANNFWHVDPVKWTRLLREARDTSESAKKTASSAKRNLQDIAQLGSLMETDKGVTAAVACTACSNRSVHTPTLCRLPADKGETCAWCRKYHLSCDAKRHVAADEEDTEEDDYVADTSPPIKKRKILKASELKRTTSTAGITDDAPVRTPTAFMIQPKAALKPGPSGEKQVKPLVGQTKVYTNTHNISSPAASSPAQGHILPPVTNTLLSGQQQLVAHSSASTPSRFETTIAGRLEILEKTPTDMRARMNALIEANEALHDQVDALASQIMEMEQRRQSDAVQLDTIRRETQQQITDLWAQLGLTAPAESMEQ